MNRPKFKVGDVVETPNHSRLLIYAIHDDVVFCVKVTSGEFLNTWYYLPQEIECCEYVGTIDLSLIGIDMGKEEK